MGCTSCATDNGLPKGCKSHGSCASGSCNKMNTFDWLADMPIAFGISEGPDYYEVSFNAGSRKEFFKNENKVAVHTGDWVVVDTSMGYDIGQVSLSGELVRLQMRKKKVKERNADFRNILRIPNEEEFQIMKEAKEMEQPFMVQARAIARSLKLDMKVGQVEVQADKKKATFYYTAEDRVDFRELIKVYAREFKVKVEMRQIGARQEAGKIGGIGSCGRELCCSTWLTDFKSVSTNAARYQNLSINLAKLSGQCGRLKCCLNYELDMYMEALQDFPKKAERLDTESGMVNLMKTDILKKMMWYTYEGDPTFYPLTVEQVAEIIELNEKGKKAQPLGQLVEVEEPDEEEVVVDYADTVGQITLSSLEKKGKKRKKKKKGEGEQRGSGQQGGRPQQQPQGKQQQQGGNRGERPQGERGERPQGERQQGNQRPQQPRPNNQPRQQQQGQQQPKAEGGQPQSDQPNQQRGEGGGNNRNRNNRNRNRGNRNRGGGESNNPAGGGGEQ